MICKMFMQSINEFGWFIKGNFYELNLLVGVNKGTG
jgi:hypothetical protein